MTGLRFLLVWTVFCLGLVGCASQETALTEDEQDAVLFFSEAKTDNLVAGMNANDYVAFSHDFDQEMLAAISQAEFEKLKTDLDNRLGLYVSREVGSIVQSGEFYVIAYNAKFEKGDVVMRVVFRVAEPHPVSGLWFK